jgi:PhoD-like phosphatase
LEYFLMPLKRGGVDIQLRRAGVLIKRLVRANNVIFSSVRSTWRWMGNLQAGSITIKIKLATDGAVAIRYGTTTAMSTTTSSVNVTTATGLIGTIILTGLAADTLYYYDAVVDGASAGLMETFRTPKIAEAYSFRVVAGACWETTSDTYHLSTIFETIANLSLKPLLMLQTGDLHYEDPGTTSDTVFRAAYDRFSNSPQKQKLLRSIPIAYTWSDHDFCGDNSNGTAAAKLNAQRVYREQVPSYTLPSSSEIYQAFTIGRVKFILTDQRSEKSAQSATDNSSKRIFSQAQEDWFTTQIADGVANHERIVWVSDVPWIATAAANQDTWGGYSTHRTAIANMLYSSGAYPKLLIVCGDAHMLAYDDGTNTNYRTGAPGGEKGPQLIQAGAVAAAGSVKGGPYSGGTSQGTTRYAVLDFNDNGTGVGLTADLKINTASWQNVTVFSTPISGYTPTDPDALAWVTAATGTYSDTEKQALNDFLAGLKTDSAFTFDRLIHFGFGKNEADANRCFVSRQSSTPVNSPLFTSLQGYKGNGTDARIDLNWALTDGTFATQNNTSFGVYVRRRDTRLTTESYYVGQNGTQDVALGVSATANTLSGRVHNASTLRPTSITLYPTDNCFYSINRVVSTDVVFRKDNLELSQSQSSTSRLTTPLSLLFRRPQDGFYSNAEIALFHAGSGMTSTQYTAFRNRIAAFHAAIGYIL